MHTPRVKTQKDKRTLYHDRALLAREQATALEALGHRLGNLRGISFAVFVISGVVAGSGDSVPAGVLSAAGLLTFFFLIPRHDRVLLREEDARRRTLLNEHALARVSGKWHELPRTGKQLQPASHPYASDLDLFGRASLYQRISVAHTRYGQRTLANWLSWPAELGEIQARAASTRELAGWLDFRQSFEAEGMALVEKRRGKEKVITDGPDPGPLIDWAREGQDLPLGAVGTGLSFLLPAATMTGFFLQVTQGAHPLFWALPLLLGLGLLSLCRATTSQTFAAVSTTEGAFLRYGALLKLLEGLTSETTFTRARLERLASGGEGNGKGASPSAVMNEFKRLVGWFDLRHNGMVYPFINAILLWDVHCTRALLAWRGRVGGRLEGWLEVIGEIEALSSLAGLLHDDPHMTLPEVHGGEKAALAATQIGHPLLSPEHRVHNDLSEFRAGEGLLVTGSNMSGKSTFLRSIGVNAVLAFAGGPVCAKHLRLSLCHLGTSIRIEDSLASGVSHFYAEVQRLAQVVEKTREGRPVLFLLDEILHGTNSRERQIGARWVFAELLERGAFGIITTHDMELCQLPDNLMQRVRQFHFRENVDDGDSPGDGKVEMTFDYTLREGPVRSGNALRLMRRVGLEVPLEEG